MEGHAMRKNREIRILECGCEVDVRAFDGVKRVMDALLAKLIPAKGSRQGWERL
jgi:hypothetical protein